MLKYVALLSVDKPSLWSQWHSCPTIRYFRSPIEEDENKVTDWLKKELEEYPDARINENISDKTYFIHTSIIAFDDEKSENFEDFLEKLIPF